MDNGRSIVATTIRKCSKGHKLEFMSCKVKWYCEKCCRFYKLSRQEQKIADLMYEKGYLKSMYIRRKYFVLPLR